MTPRKRSGSSLPPPFAGLPPESTARLRRSGKARFVQPMLATLTDEREFDERWLVEHKFDGVRCLAIASGGKVVLRTRSDRDVTSTYPEVAGALEGGADVDAVFDGEIVAVDGDEALGFERLQQRLGNAHPSEELVGRVPVALCAFDVLHLAGHDTTALALLDRKRLLEDALPQAAPLRLTEYSVGDSARRYREACEAGWEGVIAKRVDSEYVSGRSRDWLKLKCIAEQEFVIGGFTDPRRSRVGFGALLVGYYEDHRLRYAGKVGTGFDRRTLEALTGRLRSLERSESPFAEPVKPRPAGTHWVEPELVAQIGFAEWTRGARLRQPRFLGLRDDKRPEEVVRETPDP